MKDKFICSSATMGHYIDAFIDNVQPNDDCLVTVKGLEFRIDKFPDGHYVPADGARGEISVVVRKERLSALKNLCRAIPDQPITISIDEYSWINVYCVV